MMTVHRAIAPILPMRGVSWKWLTEPFDMGNRVSIGPIQAYPIPPSAMQDLGQLHAYDLSSATVALAVEYEAPPYGSASTSEQSGETPSADNNAFNTLRMANLSLWLARPNGTNFRLVFLVEDGIPGAMGEPHWNWAGTIFPDPLIPDADDSRSQLTAEDLKRGRDLFSSIQTLKRLSTPLISAEMIWKALTAREHIVRYLMLWVALESLFGPSGGGEIRFRLSQRVGFFLGATPAEARDIFRESMDGYDFRSKIVHGLHSFSPDPTRDRMQFRNSEKLVRQGLTKILSDPVLATTFSGGERGKYLDELAFAR